ncbi:MAG: PRC-barrel domain-containing protein [Verrucomicrobiales bacterium]|nr:PRC-barrel domain-containing protein [Verrucomicrobiales bacterium]
MKRKLRTFTSASAASLIALSTFAQENPTASSTIPATEAGVVKANPRTERLGHAVKASTIVGSEVRSYRGEKLGKIHDLAVDLRTGRIVQVILSSGGFLGLGDSLVAVPPGALHWDAADKVIHLNSDPVKIKNAPKFDAANWDASSESNHVAGVYRYFNEEPYFQPSGVQPRSSDDSAGLNAVQSCSKVMGLTINNLSEEKLGKVENLAVDLSAGRILAVIISSGGFLGLGDEMSAVPPSAIRFNAARDGLQLDTSKEALLNAPHFKSDQWPELGDPSYAEGVYRAYRVQPYFTTNAFLIAGNAEGRIRDRGNRALTAMDQGNSVADRDRSALIRKEILSGKEMSVNARNVKIITVDGLVTLRGPVNTAEEKRLIGAIADRIATAANVDNQLEVSLTTSSNN